MTNNIFVIVHNNGVEGSEGETEYTMSEVRAEGGINAILAEYRAHGVHVYKWYITTV